MPILTTKLTIPAKTGRLVARPRLNRAFHHKLTLVSAPAGFGKTTLLKVWLEAADGQAAWLSLDAADNTLVRFWTYVIAALQQVKNDLGAETLEILTRTVAPPAVEALLTPLLNELAALPFFLILALDDFHLIEAPEIHESLQFFLEHQPPTVHVILATRKDPMLPLSKMRARREVVEVRAGDLRFTEAEAVEFIQDIMGICLSPEAFHALEARTEGWAAGLQMAALSMLHHTDYEEFIAAFTGSHRYIMDYLMDEVLNQQPSEIRPFLLQTSILNRLSGALCDAVVDGKPTDSQQILQNLEYSNLFLVSLDDRREWYRYHSLFADLLRHHLAHSGMDIAGLHLRASEWYEQQGYIEEALRHALQAEDTTRAVRLVEQNHLQRTLKNEWNIRADWLRLLPAEIVATRPRLLLLESWLLMAQFKMEAMLAKHEQIRSLLPDLPEEDIPHLQAEIDIMASTVAIWQGAPAQSVPILEHAHDILSTHASPMLVVVNITLAIANLVAGNWKKAQAALSAAEAGGASGPFWYLTLAYLNELRGSLHDALHAYHQMLKYLDETNLMVNVSLNYIGRLYYEANDLTTAETYLKEALHFGRKNKISRILVEGSVFLSQVYSAQGKWQEAENTIQDAIDITESYMPYPVGDFARTQQATLWLRQGKLKAAAHWLEHCRLVVGKAPIVFSELEYLVRAGVLLALRKPDEALTLLESLIPTLETAGRLTTLMRIRALQALAYVQYGDLNTALLYMRESLKIARSGYIRFFIEEGVPMESLLRECVRRGIEADYAAHVLTFFSGQPPVQEKLIDPLTERELEVLSLLEERLSNQEIAQKLVISPTTVKKHTGNIYSKLDVRSRREAVTRARQLGLMK